MSRRGYADFEPQGTISKRSFQWDPAKHLRRFETDSFVSDCDKALVGHLTRTGRHDLADDLHRMLQGKELAPEWSHTGYRELRRGFTDQAVSVARITRTETGHLGVVVSMVPAGMIAQVGELHTIAPKDLKKAVWKALHKGEATNGYKAIGGIDVSFNEKAGADREPGHYQVHANIAVLGYPSDERASEVLRHTITNELELEPTAAVPVQIKPLRKPMEQLSYLMKRLFTRRVSIIDRRGRRNTLHLPLKPAQAAETATWLSGFAQTDRMILKGLRQQGNKIVPVPIHRKREDGK